MTAAADKSTRVFRRIDLDGDGIPDEPQALSAAKGVGGVVAGEVSTRTRIDAAWTRTEMASQTNGRWSPL